MKRKTDDKIEEKTEPIEEPKEAVVEDWKGKYLRALADYQNLERRIRVQSLQDKNYAAREVIIKFLVVLDDLIKAQLQIKNEGLQLIIDKFEGVLKSENVQRKDCLNSQFDESYMECVSIVEGNKDDLVVGEVRPAYFMSGEVIRTAQVVVSKKKEENIESKSEVNKI